jgi:hypothetical protein
VARIRTVKPEYWSSEQVMSVSRNSRLLFIGLWNFVDDAGRCVDSAKTVKAQVFPGDDDVSSENVRGMLDELSSKDLILKYEVDGRAYLQVTGWHHQKIDRPRPSKHPPPNSTNDPRRLATDLILSNPTYPSKRAEDKSARSFASAPSGGALAREPAAACADSPQEAWRGKPPSAVKRGELEQSYAANPKGRPS